MTKEMIEMRDSVPVLSLEIASDIVKLEKMYKTIETQEKALKKAILEEMEQKGIVKVDTPELTITYIAHTDREHFDKDRFRKEHSLMYDDYVSMRTVNSSVRIKLKG